MQTRSNDSTARVPVMQTGRKQEGQQTTGAARQLSQRPANKPRWLIPATPQGILHKTLILRTNPGIPQPPPACSYFDLQNFSAIHPQNPSVSHGVPQIHIQQSDTRIRLAKI